MKHLVFWSILLMQVCGCSQSTSNSVPLNKTDKAFTSCFPSSDPMECLQKLCKESQAIFNNRKKVCECPYGSILNTSGKTYTCERLIVTTGDGWANAAIESQHGGRTYGLFLKGTSRETLLNTLASSSGEIALLPLWNMANQNFNIYFNSSDLRDLNITPQSLRGLAGPGTMIRGFLRQTDATLFIDANSGVRDAAVGMPFFQIGFSPRQTPIRSGDAPLDAVIGRALERIQIGKTEVEITSYTEYGCAEQCTERTILQDDTYFLAYRVRTYFHGVPIQDQFSVFDKSKRRTSITVYLLNEQPIAFMLDENDGVYLHGNESDLQESRVGLVQKFPELSQIPIFSMDIEEPIVVTFEAAQNPLIASAIPRGPFTDTHVWGWFKSEDNLPFFKNYQDFPTQYGEEEVEMQSVESIHGIAVAHLATDGFKHSIIPFAGSDLMAGNFQKFVNNYRSTRPNQNLVASLSEAFVLSPKQCAQSNLGKSILQNQNIAWIISAGNSGRDLMPSSYACPQILRGSNLLKVAATAGKDSLSSVSAYGETSVDIAESGCPPNQNFCTPSDAATSYAAPRLARKISDLQRQFPRIEPKDILFAVMATARVPHARNYNLTFVSKPLPVISGGVADSQAATQLLAERSKWPKDRKLTSDEWQDLLLMAKSEQYEGLWIQTKRALVHAEAETFMKRGDLQ